MTKTQRLLFGFTFLIVMIILSSCTTDVADTDERGFSPHLTVDLQIPANIELQQIVVLKLDVKKSGKPFEQAELAEFIIWSENKMDQAVTVKASESSPGLYEAEHVFSEDGIYILKSHVASSNLEVMPAKRIAIGAEAIERIAALEQHETGESESSANHH